MLVVADDVDLPLGRLRLRREGSAGGHNGLRDIIATFGTNQFQRLRVGIGRSGTTRETVDHVLSTFRSDEQDLATEAIATAADAVELWLREGIDAAMNAYNGLDLAEPIA
jgi:PTH1 family peptidyl-tRNA hydrolase